MLGYYMGAVHCTFHPGYYKDLDRDEAFRMVKKGVEEVVESFSGECLVVLSGSGGGKSMKRRRMRASGLEKYFREVVVAGEDVRDKFEGVKLLIRRFRVKPFETVFIDDKPDPINSVSKLGVLTCLLYTSPSPRDRG